MTDVCNILCQTLHVYVDVCQGYQIDKVSPRKGRNFGWSSGNTWRGDPV